MKQILFFTVFILLDFCMVMCKKSSKKNATVNTATCTTCTGVSIPFSHSSDSSGAWYYLPSAFTPNGDGLNDILQVAYGGLDTANSSIAVWNLDGIKVFSGRITKRWDGFDLNGTKCAAGQYPVYLQLKNSAGVSFNNCTCVTILNYTGNCIKTLGVTYYFSDQLDSAGFVFPTNEILCP